MIPPDGGGSSDGTSGLNCVGGTVACGDKCIQLDLDPKNCGACGKACNAGEVCSAGMCAMNCQAGYMLCMGAATDGGMAGPACANLANDPMNCGACGNVCSSNHGVPQCNNGTCSTICLGTFADCDANPATGCESDLASDAKHCGKCDRDCLGGGCTGGLCQPITLASNQTGAYGLAIDGANVYWSTSYNGQIRSCAKSGCNNTPTTLATGQSAYGIAVDGTNVYWGNYAVSGAIQKCAIAGCSNTPTNLAVGQGYVYNVAVDNANVYWTQYGQNGGVFKCATGGCSLSPTTLAPTAWGYMVGTDGTNVYWSGFGGIRKCAVGGCNQTPVTLSSASIYGGVVSDGTNVYFTGNGSYQCAVGGCNNNPTSLASGYGLGIAFDNKDVYWAAPSSGTIARCAIGGCNNNATLVAFAQAYPEMIAVDNTAIYWTNYTSGTVVKLAK
jgi:hypothetical protein